MTLQCPLGKCQPVPIDAEAVKRDGWWAAGGDHLADAGRFSATFAHLKTMAQTATRKADIDPRSLVDQIADYHLSNWARWMRQSEERTGYDHQSAVVGNYTASTSVDDMYDSKDKSDAKIANAAIESLTPIHQVAIHNVYLNSVWRYKGDLEAIFVEAVAAFWVLGQKRGLI